LTVEKGVLPAGTRDQSAEGAVDFKRQANTAARG